MQKLLLLATLFFTVTSINAQTQCNPTLAAASTTIISSTMLMDTTSSVAAQGQVLICGGNTLTYNSYLGKDFYIRTGATLILKAAQIVKIYMEPGATLVIDTNGAVFSNIIFNGIAYDSTNATFVDTNQAYIPSGPPYWNHCLGNTFNYTGFAPIQPCTPLSVADNDLSVFNLEFENPVRDNIILNGLMLEKTKAVLIIDIAGKVIKNITQFNQPIDVSYLPQGIYFLELKSKNGSSAVSKFLKD